MSGESLGRQCKQTVTVLSCDFLCDAPRAHVEGCHSHTGEENILSLDTHDNAAPCMNIIVRGMLFILLACTLVATTHVASAVDLAGMAGVPKVPAFLPNIAATPPTSGATPIDGTWLIGAISKKIRIEKGRSYAVDGWQHLFVLDIQPGMVVGKDIQPTAPGKYTGYDLPWMSKFTLDVTASGGLAMNIQAVTPINLDLVPVQLDNQAWFNQEMQAAWLQPAVPTTPSAPPAYQFTPPPGAPPVYSSQPGYSTPPPTYGEQPTYGAPPQYGGQPPGYAPAPPSAPPPTEVQPGETPGCVRGLTC